MLSRPRYNEMLRNVETTTRKRRLMFAGTLVRMNDERLLPKRIMSRELADGKAPGQGQPKKSWVRRLDEDRKRLQAIQLGILRVYTYGVETVDCTTTVAAKKARQLTQGSRERTGSLHERMRTQKRSRRRMDDMRHAKEDAKLTNPSVNSTTAVEEAREQLADKGGTLYSSGDYSRL